MKRERKFFTLALCAALACAGLSTGATVSAAETAAVGEELQLEAVQEEFRLAGDYYSAVTADTVVDGYYILKVSSAEMKESEKALKTALQTAGTNATAQLPYKIVVEPGTYTVNGLSILSNTYLYLEGVTLKRDTSSQQNLLRVGSGTEDEKGYCYENITIYGGVFDMNKGSQTAFKVGHASNFFMENLTLQNSTDAHMMEVAGVNGFTVKGCTFKNQIISSKATRDADEVIQFDVFAKDHINGYAYEDLTSQNILIEGCTFSNVSRGVGSHNAVLNNPIHDIRILNNTFTKLKSVAISFMDCRNCTISGNTITGAPRGIALYGITANATYFGTTLSKDSTTSKKYIKPVIDQNIVITDNKINCSGKDVRDDIEVACVALIGYNIAKPEKQTSSDTVPKGDYYISGVTVANNILTTTNYGIQLHDTKNTMLENNVITAKGSVSGKDGIRLDLGSTDNTIVNNTIKNALGCGIGLYNASSAKQINGNTITKPKDSGIMFYTSASDEVNNNVITKPKNVGIVLAVGSDAKQISGNKISSASAMGINIADAKSEMEISLNTVKACNTAQIYVQVTSKKNISINDNTVTGKSGTQGIWAATGNVSITGNTVKGCYNGVLVNTGVKGIFGGNKLTGNTNNYANIGGKDIKNVLSAPKSLKVSKTTKNSVQLSWGKVSGAKGYIIYRSDAENGSYRKVAQTKKTTYKNSKLSGGTTYYYKVAAYTKSGKVQLLGGFSSAAEAATK